MYIQYILLDTNSSVNTVSLISNITTSTDIMTSVEPTSRIFNSKLNIHIRLKWWLFIVPGNFYLLSGILVAMVILMMTSVVIIYISFIVQKMSKKPLITLNEGMWNYYYFIILFLVRVGIQYTQSHNNRYVTSINYHYYSVTLHISYEVPVQLTTTTTDPYHKYHHEVCTRMCVIIFSCVIM